MVLTPLEIYNKEFKKSLRGYNEDDVDNFIDKVLVDYEKLYKDNLDLAEKLEQYQESLQQYKKIEETLHNSIIVAQQTAEEVKKSAEERADLIIQQAEQRARKIVTDSEDRLSDARHEYEGLLHKSNLFKIKLRSYFRSQLEALDDDLKQTDPKNEESTEN